MTWSSIAISRDYKYFFRKNINVIILRLFYVNLKTALS